MKKQSLKVLAFALVFGFTVILGTANSASAQSGRVAVFDVSFDFQVGNQLMKAGRYNLRKTGSEMFFLYDEKRKQTMLIPGTAALAPENNSSGENLIFNKYGDRYFLRGIYNERQAVGYSVSESKAEKKVRQNGNFEAERLARVIVQSASKPNKN